MKNKGQTLVIFILILPILLLLLALIFEIGALHITKIKYENAIKDAIEYGLTHQEENMPQKLESLLKANIKGNINIEINNYIKINVKQK